MGTILHLRQKLSHSKLMFSSRAKPEPCGASATYGPSWEQLTGRPGGRARRGSAGGVWGAPPHPPSKGAVAQCRHQGSAHGVGFEGPEGLRCTGPEARGAGASPEDIRLFSARFRALPACSPTRVAPTSQILAELAFL